MSLLTLLPLLLLFFLVSSSFPCSPFGSVFSCPTLAKLGGRKFLRQRKRNPASQERRTVGPAADVSAVAEAEAEAAAGADSASLCPVLRQSLAGGRKRVRRGSD